MTFILPSFGASAISAVPGGGGGGDGFANTYSVDFDGTNDYMDVGNITAVNSVANASYSFWYKTSATGIVGLLGGGVGTSAYHWSDGTMYVHSWIGTSAHAISIPTLGVWHHIVNTFEASGSKLYVDGSLQSTVDHGDTTAASAGNNFAVGKVPHYNILDGQKLIDEVAFFTSTLSASDVTAIYNSGVPGDLTSYSPVAWWRMGDNDSGTGTTITDQGSGGNDGTLTNGPTFVQGVPSVPAAYSNTYSLDFDGTDDYLATTYQYGSATQFTYSFWIKTTDTGNSHWVGNSFSGANDTRFHFGTKGGAYYFLLGNSSGQYQVSNAGSASAVTDGNWHHMVFQWDGTNTNGVNLYVDGNTTPVFTYTSNRASNASTAALKWGTGWSGGFYAYDGLMDEAALFESILSTSDITTLYNSGVPGDISSLNPVGWWRMGDNDGGTGTTITDQGSGGNDGTLTNGPTFVQGVPSVPAAYSNTYSLDFDGTDDYISTELSVAGQSELTVSAWVKLDLVSATRGFVTQYVGSGDRAFRLAYFPSLQSMWFEVYGSGSYAGYKDASITTGTWYHVAGVFSQSSCVVYVNGVASTTTAGLHNSATGNIATCTDNIDIGRMGNADYMDGNIDEVGIWTSALSASDITAIYNSGVPADISSYSPVLYYRMGDNDGGTGTTITDQGSGGNDGTFTNGPTFSTDVPT